MVFFQYDKKFNCFTHCVMKLNQAFVRFVLVSVIYIYTWYVVYGKTGPGTGTRTAHSAISWVAAVGYNQLSINTHESKIVSALDCMSTNLAVFNSIRQSKA